MPADLVGTRIYRPDTGRFDTELGPVFGNFLLADEINRAPAKVQSALLEVMQEHQVTIGGQTYPVPDPFLVLATQNPIESEGTYPLPEAQVDRFLFKLVVDYPTLGEEAAVVGRSLERRADAVRERLSLAELERYAAVAREVFVDRDVIAYAVALADAHAPPGAATASASSSGSSSTAPARAGRSAWSRPPRRWRCCAAAGTCSSTTCATSPPTSCATASCSPTTRSATASPPTTILDARARRRAASPPAGTRDRRGPLARVGRHAAPAGRAPGTGPDPARARRRARAAIARRGAGRCPATGARPASAPGTELAQLRPVRGRRRRAPARRRGHARAPASRTCACTCPSAR